MRSLLYLFLTCSVLLAFPFELESIDSKFEQRIVDDHNKTITYTGTLLAKKPSLAHWHYATPIEKDIYIKQNYVTIIEPDLEQVIKKDLGENIDIISIVKRAKEVSENYYIAIYNEKKYHIHLSEAKVLHSIGYDDDFGNKTTIEFIAPKLNEAISDAAFEVTIPEGFDIIR